MIFLKVIIKIIKKMEMEFINIQMVDNMMAIGKMMKCQVKETIYGKVLRCLLNFLIQPQNHLSIMEALEGVC